MFTWLLIALPALGAEPIGEAWVLAPLPEDRALLSTMPVGFAESREGPWVLVHGTASELEVLETHAWQIRDRRPDHRVSLRRAAGYHTPESMVAALEDLAEAHPERAQLVTLGYSVENRPIVALRLGQPGHSTWRILGAHHGDELSSAELAFEVARSLVEETGDFAGLLDQREVWVVPHVNPDGVANGSRYNAHSVDLNRNYSFHWSESEYRSGDAPFSEPETRAVRSLSLYEAFGAGHSMHSGATNIGYVWNWTTSATIEEARLEALGNRYASACTQAGFWVTNGADWYVTNGDTNDWSYGMRSNPDYTLEISSAKTPDTGALEEAINDHLPAVAAWLSTETPLAGSVIDADTGRGIPAQVEVLGATPPFPTDPENGVFARILEAGDWTLRVTAPGYASQEIDVHLQESGNSRLTVALSPHNLQLVRPSPVILPRGSTVELSLPIDDLPPNLTLSRAGAPSVSIARQGDVYPINPDSLLGGPYDLSTEDWVSPRSIFVGNLSDTPRIDFIGVTDKIVLEGAGFAQGSRAYALWGQDRALHRLSVLEESEALVVLSASSLPEDTLVDLVLVTRGRELSVVDLLTNPGLDTGAPADSGEENEENNEDSGSGLGPGSLVVAGGCSHLGGRDSIPLCFLGLLVLSLSRRSRPCNCVRPSS